MVVAQEKEERTMFTIRALSERWRVSPWTVRSLLDSNKLTSVRLGSRRMISLAEILRVEANGADTRGVE